MKALTLNKGMTIDGARLLRHLGSGHNGEVWSGVEKGGTHVALKIFHGKDEAEGIARREYSTALEFPHENILAPTGLSAFDSHPVIFMPYCEGRSVSGAASHFSEKGIWRLIKEISGALGLIHDKGYGHFDVRPANILWDGQKFLLSGFDFCSPPGDTAFSGDTHPDAHRFRAPEFATAPSAASDIWAFGASVFYLFMGCHVFSGLGGRAQHKDSPVPFMRKSMPELSKLIVRCLDFEPASRPTAGEIYETACGNLSALESAVPGRNRRNGKENRNIGQNDDFWPEQMIETANINHH